VPRRRPVAISKLAAYAADPDGFVARHGGPISARGARYGDRYHERFGQPPRSRWKRRVLISLVLLALLVLAYLMYRG
jgi:hypothetical protein